MLGSQAHVKNNANDNDELHYRGRQRFRLSVGSSLAALHDTICEKIELSIRNTEFGREFCVSPSRVDIAS